jgi:membrane protease YdiL (CAAX protease family)
LGWAKTYILALVSERIGADLRTTTYQHLMKLSLEYFGGKRTGDLMARIGSESDRICLFLSLHLLDFATDVLMILMTAAILISIISNEDNAMKPWKVAVPGIIFLLSIGFGEELVARGFIYGVLKRRSHKAAIFVSSFFFGLMHLNLYTGSDWDPWLAYWHVMSAFCFGFLMCAIMIATRSIWVAVLVHALMDWSVVFDKTPPKLADNPPISYPFWEGLTSPFSDFVMILFPALLILFFSKPRKIWVPRWLKGLAIRLAIKLKLVDESSDKPALVGQN